MTEIRSYRSVFDLERRIYRVDRLRLNPGGVPVRGVLYFLGLLAAGMVFARLPLGSAIARLLPWYVRDALLPGVGAGLLALVRVEGRPFDLAALALLRRAARPRLLDGAFGRAPIGRRWHPPDVLFLPDGSEGSLRRMRYTGPGAVLIAIDHELADSQRASAFRRVLRRPRATVTVSAHTGEGGPSQARVLVLTSGASLLCRPGRSRRC